MKTFQDFEFQHELKLCKTFYMNQSKFTIQKPTFGLKSDAVNTTLICLIIEIMGDFFSKG